MYTEKPKLKIAQVYPAQLIKIRCDFWQSVLVFYFHKGHIIPWQVRATLTLKVTLSVYVLSCYSNSCFNVPQMNKNSEESTFSSDQSLRGVYFSNSL